MTSSRILLLRLVVAAGAVAQLCSGTTLAQSVQPPPPKEYDVQVRFRLRQPVPQWYDSFDQMLAFMKSAGFVRDVRPEDEPEDPDSDRVTGRIAADGARKLLRFPLIQTILLKPQGYQIPAPGQRVKVSLELVAGLGRDRQSLFHQQCVAQLDQIGFREFVGYDHRGFSRIFGSIASEDVPRLIRDLRTEPSGWLVPRTPVGELPAPISRVVPIKVVEVVPEPNDVAPAQEASPAPVFAANQVHLAKISPELRVAVGGIKDEKQKLRVEVILRSPPQSIDRIWEKELRAAALGSVVEGRLGTVVTMLCPAGKVAELARPSSVLALRLPRSGETKFRPLSEKPADILKEMRLPTYHEMGYRGKGIKVAVIAGDFGGYQKLLGNLLPADTKIVDLTTSRNQDLRPDPMPSDDGVYGQGVLCAVAVRHAAPQAEIVLVRIDPAAPYQLLAVAKILNGEPAPLENLEDRVREITRDTDALQARRQMLLDERKKAVEGLSFEEGDTKLPELRKRYEESQARLKRVLKDIEDLQLEEKDLRARTDRMLTIQAQFEAMKNVRVAVCPLVWNGGHPLDGASDLSRYFDETPFQGHAGDASKTRIASLRANRNTLWVQAAGDTRGQTWAGLFRDADGNGVLEFVPDDDPLRPSRWSHELNFMGWQAYGSGSTPDLPEKVRLRISMQWREPHDPDLAHELDDPYRDPLANFELIALRQRDPSGAKLGTDDFEVLARSTAAPIRLFKSPISGIYEQSIEVDATVGGRLALRVQGRVPNTTRPASIPTLPEQQRRFEIRPRIFVEVLDAPSRARGRVVFLDYAGETNWPRGLTARASFGSVGMPADARNVLCVGGADAQGRLSAYGAVGAGPSREILTKPDFLGFESVDLGDRLKGSSTGLAAALNAGAAACLIGSGAPATPRHFTQLLQMPPDSVLRIPAAWLQAREQR